MKNKIHTVEQLGKRYREAWIISRRVPSGLQLGYSASWPEFNPNRWEVYHAEGVKAKPTPVSADAVDRMVECMRWLRWLSEDERELVWMRASGMSWREIAGAAGKPRTTVYRYWHRALLQVTLSLNC